MKKLLIALMAVSMLAVGCAKKVEKEDKAAGNPCYVGAPTWVLDPTMEGGLSSSGSAKIGQAGIQFARTEALANGRDELARMMSVRVQNMVKNFTQVTGIGDAQTVDKVTATVSKQVSNEVLQGSRQKDLWISPCNELHVLVVMDPNVAKQAVENAVTTSLRNEQALWQQFQAKKAQDELAAEIEKEFGGGGGM